MLFASSPLGHGHDSFSFPFHVVVISWNVIGQKNIFPWLLVSGNQQVIGSPCQLAVCHWSPSVARANNEGAKMQYMYNILAIVFILKLLLARFC